MLRDIDDADDVSDVDEEERAEDAADMEMVAAVIDDDELDDVDDLTLTREDVNLGRFSVHKVRHTLLSNSLSANAIIRLQCCQRESSTTPPFVKSWQCFVVTIRMMTTTQHPSLN
jgi:hypothetical protein